MNAAAARSYPYQPDYLGPLDRDRGEHTSLRYDMLRGRWGPWLQKAIQAHVPRLRQVSWGPQDMTSNVFRGIASEVGGVPYLSEPGATGAAGSEPLIGRDGILEKAGFWPLMQGACEDLVGLREIGMRLGYSTEGGLTAEPVPAHLVSAEAPSWAPQSPHRAAVLDLRLDPDKHGYLWTREEWDVSDSASPSYRIVAAADPTRDLTAAYARKEIDGEMKPASSADLSGKGYYWRWTQGDRKGRPFIPLPIYHAQRRAELWDPWYGVEAVAGSLTLAVLHTFWVHCIRDGSIATVALVGGVPVGVNIESADGDTPPIAWVAIEAGAFNLFSPSHEGVTPQLIQLRPQADALQLIQAIQSFEERVALYAGVSASDLVRTSGDPRSGYSLAISAEGKRRASRRLEPQLRAGDVQTLEIAACIANISTGSAIPETGYRTSYGVLPVSIEERETVLRYVSGAMSSGLMTRRDAIRLLRPDLSETEAIQYLAQAAMERAAMMPTFPAPQ